MATEVQACKVCGAAALEEIPEFRFLPRVTSDCKPFRAGGRLLVCRICGAEQSAADQQWFEEVCEIYRSYSAYHQAGGMEQCIPDPATGNLMQRSRILVNRLLALDGVPQSGKILDVGCGTGGTLRPFSAGGGWRLFGLELDDRNLPLLQSIENFDTLYTCSPSDLPDQFALITVVHAREHFPDPLTTLCSLHGKIIFGGRLFIEVPNAEANPFDYLIADHMVHFRPATLSALIQRAGFAVDSLATNWVAKELSLTARPAQVSAVPLPLEPGSHVLGRARAQIGWLRRLLEIARARADAEHTLGIFGSSIAATWLCSILKDSVSFFVDEDPNRMGRVHLGKPILSPSQAPIESVVLLAMVPQIANEVAERLRNAHFHLCLPPDLN